MGDEAKAIAEYYTPQRLQALITWRKKKEGKSICKGFCKHHKTDHCPHTVEPKEGYCKEFRIGATSMIQAQQLLESDAGRSGISLSNGSLGASSPLLAS